MDFAKLIDVVQQYPQVWDRTNASFREKNFKKTAWDEVGNAMGYPGALCKDMFKSLREKYIREREKQKTQSEGYIPWPYLDKFRFLDPHILLRRQSQVTPKYEVQIVQRKTNPSPIQSPIISDDDRPDFDRLLIQLVRKATPIWDRRNNGYPSKQLKLELWRTIAQNLHKDVNACMLRWKGLREKYIRQKNKYQEGDSKWPFLNEMSFLDNVIQYRRKQSETIEYTSQCDFYDYSPIQCNVYAEEGNSSELTTCQSQFDVKSEQLDYDSVDSSYDSGTGGYAKRKRSISDASESSDSRKRNNAQPESATKAPEEMFAELVASMLARKTERNKNIAMIEIMKILAKD